MIHDVPQMDSPSRIFHYQMFHVPHLPAAKQLIPIDILINIIATAISKSNFNDLSKPDYVC